MKNKGLPLSMLLFTLATLVITMYWVHELLTMEYSSNLIVAIIALIWYGFKYHYDQQSELNKQKREVYLEFINVFMILIRKDRTGEIVFDAKGKLDRDYAVKLYDVMQKMVLYAPANICLASNDFWNYIRGNTVGIEAIKVLEKISKIFLLMRKDIWLDSQNLWTNGEELMRSFITDMDDLKASPIR